MRFLIDIDGTVLTQQKPGEYEKAVPLEGAIEAVNALYDAGHQVVFYTSRNFKHLQQTYESLRGFGFRFHHVSFGKPHGDIIVDDRALGFRTWTEMVRAIETRIQELSTEQKLEGH